MRLRDMARAVRAGGRVLVVFDAGMGVAGRLGFGGSQAGAAARGQALKTALESAGFRPVRVLAEREGLLFVEGFRPAAG